MSPLLKIKQQCCDAGMYINYGTECATEGVCHGPLRPMGDYFWFAIPYKMGWPLDSLIALHFMLLGISVVLSALAIGKLAGLPGITVIKRKYRLALLAPMISAALWLLCGSVIFDSVLSSPERWQYIATVGFLFLSGSTCLIVWMFYIFLTLVDGKNTPRKLNFVFLLVISSLIHLVFFWPTLFHTLSDPPAVLMLLIGIWLLILAFINGRNGKMAVPQLFFAGIFLGLSVWLRAFYLFPVLLGLAVYFVCWVFCKDRRYRELLLLLALVPIGTQYAVMHNVYGTYSYLEKNTTNIWRNVHLNTPVIGYDTVFPHMGWSWYGRHCSATLGLLGAIKAGAYDNVACLLYERLYFYLGTYVPKTYIFSNGKNMLVHNLTESIGKPGTDWYVPGLDFEEDVVFAPNGEKLADKLSFSAVTPDGKGDAIMWVPLKADTTYTFSVWLWSPLAKTINLAIKTREGDVQVARQQFRLNAEPTRYSITGTTLEEGLYDVDIGRTPYPDAAMTFGTAEGDFFYAWGAQLEQGIQATEFDASGSFAPDSVRTWHAALLLLHVVMILTVLIAVISGRTFWLQQRTGLLILAVMCGALVQSVAIVPEQRFSIGWLVFLWLIAVSFLCIASKPEEKNREIIPL